MSCIWQGHSLGTYGMMNAAYGAELNVTLNDDDMLCDKNVI